MRIRPEIDYYPTPDFSPVYRCRCGYVTLTVRPSTLDGYRNYTKHYIKPYLGDKRVSQVTSIDVQKLYAKLKQEGRVHEHPKYGHQLSDAMVVRIHAVFHQAMKIAEQEHLIARKSNRRYLSAQTELSPQADTQ